MRKQEVITLNCGCLYSTRSPSELWGRGCAQQFREEPEYTICPVILLTNPDTQKVKVSPSVLSIWIIRIPWVEISRQENWSELQCSPPGELPHCGTEPTALTFPVLATSATWEAPSTKKNGLKMKINSYYVPLCLCLLQSQLTS